jgi:hypothetical protein
MEGVEVTSECDSATRPAFHRYQQTTVHFSALVAAMLETLVLRGISRPPMHLSE